MFLAAGLPIYARRAPEKSTLYETVRENLETLYGAIDDGALEVKIPKHAKKELESTSRKSASPPTFPASRGPPYWRSIVLRQRAVG